MLSALMKGLGLNGNHVANIEDDDEPTSNESESEETETDDSHSTQKIRTIGIVSHRFDGSAVERVNLNEGARNVTSGEDKEYMKGTGIITRLDETMPKGVIDRTYYFDIATFCSGNHKFSQMCKVDFEAVRTLSNPAWSVSRMKLHATKKELDLKETLRRKTLVVQVKRIDPENIEVQWGDQNTQLIPNSKDILPKHPLMEGDWLKIHVEQIYEDETEESVKSRDLGFGESMGKILSVEPNQQKIIVGKVVKKYGEHCIDGEIYYTLEVVKGNRLVPVDTLVQCKAVSSTQEVGRGEKFQWRAIDVCRSNFMEYTSDPHNRDEDGFFEYGTFDDFNLRLRDLYHDRFGIKIEPRWIKFQPVKTGDTATRTVTIRNTSGNTFVLYKISFCRDQVVCLLDLDLPQQEKHAIRTIGPDESFTFQVICTPLQIGRTKELCMFDFGDFKIARDFIMTGLIKDEELLNKIKYPNENGYGNGYLPVYHKFRGDEDIGKIRLDNSRTRIRGAQPVRAPFFMPKRIPHFKVPDDIWVAFQKKDEDVIKRKFPGSLQILDFSNYKQKFDVGLWFEEVDNDLRRRQYDMNNVRLKKIGDCYAFSVLGIQEFHPPVLVGDSVDAFDPDDPNNIKYQGFIKKIMIHKDEIPEVQAQFHENFNQNYSGVPLTIQFCLGRMTYKRQHFAVHTAVEILGKDFIFPIDMVEIKAPRIPFFEDEDDFCNDLEEVEKIIKDSKDDENPEVGLFRTHKPRPMPNNFIKKISTGDKNKRAQSLRTPFKSTPIETEFLSEVKLKWFNKALNEEQQNAVRRILRGQARPLPYIIYGPPGTGKTVTVVEAIMQVNKLDPNSRVLVAAPTNHAADVIAEYLVSSKQYHPGDFVRFNGFMRQKQSMIETIKEFCADGEFLDSVARHRLIICTCATAGQFFTLNLMPGHFTHVFIDEAGYCTEPETMISANNLDIVKGGQLILAGDPNQLGPVLMSDIAKNLGLDISFLERLMNGRTGVPNLYGRDPDKSGDPNRGYNPLVLTKLVKNYRAHETLLKLPSRLFYNGDLESYASKDDCLTQNPLIVEKVLKAQGVPLVFHGVQGNSVREKDSPSWCNAAEVMQVVDYVRKLKQCGLTNDDFGIITPYRKQAEKIRLALQLGLLEDETPKVGSVEEFQGGERKVMIISTVRSVYEHKIDSSLNKLGFLYNSKRFNVAITRAKSLMIIIGNPHVLQKDKRWKELIQYCLDLEAYTGCNLPLELDRDAMKLCKEMKKQEAKEVVPTLPPDIPTGNYNPDGVDEFDD